MIRSILSFSPEIYQQIVVQVPFADRTGSIPYMDLPHWKAMYRDFLTVCRE